ncbi:YceI family protein [Oleiharenicola lentus]|uniref:YceI family protein n=1 Tax=Oleiharenicola lentus TaxID=2508720 RepID=UPI003F6622FD
MKIPRCLNVLVLALPLIGFAAGPGVLKVDRSRSFIEVDVDATKDFTARLDHYDLAVTFDAANKVKSAVLTFKFTDLKTSDSKRDADMIAWLGGGSPEGKFDLGNIAQVPNGQGQVSGRLSFHGAVERVEIPISFAREGNDFTITGETVIDYRNWNLPKIRKAMLFTVDPDVKVRFKISGTVVEAPPEPKK